MNDDPEAPAPLSTRHGPAMGRAEAAYLHGLRPGKTMEPHLSIEALLVAWCADKHYSDEYRATQWYLVLRKDRGQHRDIVSHKIWRAFHSRHRFAMRYSGNANLFSMSNQFDAENSARAARAAIEEMLCSKPIPLDP